MLTIASLRQRDAEYYVDLPPADYYRKDGEPLGTSIGSGAKALGLTGKVTEEQLRALTEGHCPTTRKPLQQE